ncbi:LysR family transcriptional regulator [Aminipila butyrica]|uniref:LysR family transcriptional regulator n=1 Tax=Aminipila butyrica TaxID=433296 RepID=A0A858BVV8_9FIRM|nr:LysR family transcriptional regulator [Aminipila butyrica]QIB69205.1 LysR family transcriptional regulator [Aminipila butyrica]
MSYTKYQAFLKVVELKSFTKAGKSLGYTQSAVSQMLNSLEEELNTTLLFRSKSGIAVTDEGLELLPFIEDLCHSHDTLSERAISMHNIDKGIIKIGLIHSVAHTWIADLMAHFKVKYPNVQYQLVTGSSRQIQELATTQSIDFGFVYLPVTSELIDVKLLREELCLVGARPDSMTGPLALEDLGNLEFIESQGNEELGLLEKIAAQKGIRLKKALSAPDLLSAAAMAEKGLGLVAMNQNLAETFRCKTDVLPLAFPASAEVAVIFNDLNRVSRTGKCFLDLLVETYCTE